jgi:hypothetical protein
MLSQETLQVPIGCGNQTILQGFDVIFPGACANHGFHISSSFSTAAAPPGIAGHGIR